MNRAAVITQNTPNRPDRSCNGLIVLHDVLHVPEELYNFISGTKLKMSYTVGLKEKQNRRGELSKRGSIKDGRGRQVAYILPEPAMRYLSVHRHPDDIPVAKSKIHGFTLGKDKHIWSDEEKKKWQDFQVLGPEQTELESMISPYTSEEKRILEANFDGGEEEFLAKYELYIESEKERADGRLIFRAELASGRLKAAPGKHVA
jgi:hypothetical protein